MNSPWLEDDFEEVSMSEHCHDGHEHVSHHCACANLFGCGDELGTGIIREDIKDAAFQKRSADTLRHMDEVSQETLDVYLSARGRERRTFLKARTGLLPQNFAEGQIKYVDLDLAAMRGKLMPDITVPLQPFQGTFGGGTP